MMKKLLLGIGIAGVGFVGGALATLASEMVGLGTLYIWLEDKHPKAAEALKNGFVTTLDELSKSSESFSYTRPEGYTDYSKPDIAEVEQLFKPDETEQPPA